MVTENVINEKGDDDDALCINVMLLVVFYSMMIQTYWLGTW